MIKENNNLKQLTENQKWYYQKIMKLGKNKKVKQISYDELFAVLDRVKFCYFLDLMKEENKIKVTKETKDMIEISIPDECWRKPTKDEIKLKKVKGGKNRC